MKIRDGNELLALENNKFFGKPAKLIKSSITFNGENNILICEEGVILKKCHIRFNLNNSILYVASSNQEYKVNIHLNNNNTCVIGKNCYFNGKTKIFLSEEKNVIIGNNCLFSGGIYFRVADPHLIYSSESLKRINPTKSIYVGDHVWIGQDSLILKGCKIGSGSIIGAGSILSNKEVPSNTIFAGNPAKLIKKDIFWDGQSVHAWTNEDTKKMENYNSTQYIFDFDNQTCDFDEIEDELNRIDNVDDKLEFIQNNIIGDFKNRFFIGNKLKTPQKLQINTLALINTIFNKLK